MARYQLKADCCFVDALDPVSGDRKPNNYPFPHVFNQKTKTYVPFNDAAGFIARFIVLGVDTGVIPQILVSEYGASKKMDPAAEVAQVYNMMKAYLEPRKGRKPHSAPGKWPAATKPKHTGKLRLSFSTNPIGYVNLKTPTS
jgi:hypothetical protein